MRLLKAIGTALMAAIVTFVAIISGFIFSIFSTILGMLLSGVGIFLLVFLIIWDLTQKDEDKSDKRRSPD